MTFVSQGGAVRVPDRVSSASPPPVRAVILQPRRHEALVCPLGLQTSVRSSDREGETVFRLVSRYQTCFVSDSDEAVVDGDQYPGAGPHVPDGQPHLHGLDVSHPPGAASAQHGQRRPGYLRGQPRHRDPGAWGARGGEYDPGK